MHLHVFNGHRNDESKSSPLTDEQPHVFKAELAEWNLSQSPHFRLQIRIALDG